MVTIQEKSELQHYSSNNLMDKCVIASDSFKETLSSKQIADLFEIEYKKVFSNAVLEKVVLGDGGETH